MDKEIDVVVPSLYGMFNAEQDKLKTVILQALLDFESKTGAHVGKMKYTGIYAPTSDASKGALEITYKVR